jgi:hypothetical protein
LKQRGDEDDDNHLETRTGLMHIDPYLLLHCILITFFCLI